MNCSQEFFCCRCILFSFPFYVCLLFAFTSFKLMCICFFLSFLQLSASRKRIGVVTFHLLTITHIRIKSWDDVEVKKGNEKNKETNPMQEKKKHRKMTLSS